MSAITLIQAMLAPAVMISACGLLLLGVSNKYSMVISRIRELKREKRTLGSSVDEKVQLRLHSIGQQVSRLHRRVFLVRNAVIGYTSAIVLFVLTSFSAGILLWINIFQIEFLAFGCFILGMTCVLTGALFSAFEAWEGYQIILIEIGEPNDENANS